MTTATARKKTKEPKKRERVSFSVQSSDLKKADSVFRSLGVERDIAFAWFTKEVAKSGKIPFEVEDPFYSEANMKRLRKSIQAAKEGKLTPHELIEV